MPYSGVKTNIIFFDRVGSTRDIWYYEIDLGRKLTKNKPITYGEIKDITNLQKTRATSQNSWIVRVEDIRDFDLSAKNPSKAKEEVLKSPIALFAEIETRNQEISQLMKDLGGMIHK